VGIIVRKLQGNKSAEEVRNLVYGVFAGMFEYGTDRESGERGRVDPGGIGKREDFNSIGGEIFDFTNSH